MKVPSEMSFSDCVNASLAKGWGMGDQGKMMKAFEITRSMADKVANACENEYVAAARAAKAEAIANGTYGAKAPHTGKGTKK